MRFKYGCHRGRIYIFLGIFGKRMTSISFDKKKKLWTKIVILVHCVFQLCDDAIDFCDEKILCKSVFMVVEKTMKQWKKVTFQEFFLAMKFFDAFL